MNLFIETLNLWGGNFLSFVWPMLWQSSLLIAALFVFDFLFQRKVRASIRYALWLVVLVKLCVPPTLALPTSPAWWLHRTSPPMVAKPERHYTVTYDNSPLPEMSQALLPAFVPSKPAMTFAACLLVFAVSISSALLAWLLVRWWQITQQVRRAKISERLAVLAGEAQNIIGMKFKVQAKLTTNSMSPAVCGLFRPAILIPQSLVENFSDEQLRAVLLHELIHLRRRDVWVNFLQALLQIFYWWHPLVWLANARIRHVREEAVDDAVMFALNDEAENYAPTLLEVAKLALNRPLVSLGLVGILESRHALRQRIERLMDFRAPRKAGLTFASVCGIFVFSAVALPMGEAPTPNDEQTSLASAHVESAPQTVLEKTNSPAILIEAQIYRMSWADFEKIVSDPAFAESKQDKVKNFQEVIRLLKTSGFHPVMRPRIQTRSGEPAIIFTGNGTNGVEFECRPFVTNGLIELASGIKIISTTENVRMTNQLNDQITLENGGGHMFSVKSGNSFDESNIVVTLRAEIVTNQFQQRLQKILKRADGTNFEANGNSTNLFTRTFKVDTRTFVASLKRTGAELGDRTNSPAAISAAVRNFFTSLGVDFASPAGKAVFFNDSNGMLFVKATETDLGVVEQAIETLNYMQPQIHIKARFLEVPRGATMDFSDLLNSTNFAGESFTGILNATNAKIVLHSLEARKGVVTLAEPEVVTISGRQTQMRATQTITVLTNFAFQESTTNGNGTSAIFPQMEQVETGPILDVVPHVLADGYTINLTVTPSLTEFLGYANPPDVPDMTGTNNRVQLPVILPQFSVRTVTANLNLWDNQTVILGGLPEISHFTHKTPVLGSVPLMRRFFQTENTTTNEILVLITATIVDPAGNRIHSDREMSFTQNAVPAQPVR